MKLFDIFEAIDPIKWRDISGWPYQISTDGRVRNSAGQLIRPWDHVGKGGLVYHRVTLRNKGRRVNARVHRLVAQAFLPNPHNHPEVDHLDHNTQNNHVKNLEWVSSIENIRRRR